MEIRCVEKRSEGTGSAGTVTVLEYRWPGGRSPALGAHEWL